MEYSSGSTAHEAPLLIGVSSSSSLKSLSSTILNAEGFFRNDFPLGVICTSPKFSISPVDVARQCRLPDKCVEVAAVGFRQAAENVEGVVVI